MYFVLLREKQFQSYWYFFFLSQNYLETSGKCPAYDFGIKLELFPVCLAKYSSVHINAVLYARRFLLCLRHWTGNLHSLAGSELLICVILDLNHSYSNILPRKYQVISLYDVAFVNHEYHCTYTYLYISHYWILCEVIQQMKWWLHNVHINFTILHIN